MKQYRYDSERAVFVLSEHCPISEEDYSVVAKLNTLLERTGGSIELEERPGRNNDGMVRLLSISFSPSGTAAFVGRGAGRNRKLTAGYKLYTVGEVRQMLTDQSADEVAKKLGISRSTLFRRLKDREDNRVF